MAGMLIVGCTGDLDKRVVNSTIDESMVVRTIEDYSRLAYGGKDVEELDKERSERLKTLIYNTTALEEFVSSSNKVLEDKGGLKMRHIEVVSSKWEVQSGLIIYQVVADITFGENEMVKRLGFGLVKTYAGFKIADVRIL